LKLASFIHNIELYIITNYYDIYEKLDIENIINIIDCIHLVHRK